MEQIFDLPLHPLVVHFPAVAIPVLVILTIWLVVRPEARRRFGLPVALLAVVTAVATVVAASSGQALVDGSPFFTEETISDHKSLGETLRIFVILLTVALLAFLGLGRFRDGQGSDGGVPTGDGSLGEDGTMAMAAGSSTSLRDPVMMGLGGAAVALALLSGVWVIRTGHEGAKASWGDVFASDDADATENVGAADPTAVPEPDPEPEPAVVADPTAVPEPEPEPTDAVYADPEPTAEPEPEAEPEPDPAATVDFDDPSLAAAGQAVFEANCVRCHGSDGVGTSRGPTLAGIATVLPDPAEAVVIVTDGAGRMPGFADSLTADEIDAVVAYIRATF